MRATPWLSSLFAWSVGSTGAPILSLIGFGITVVGFPLAIWGLRLTYLQAAKAKASAFAAAEAVEAFRLKVDHYSAYRDIAEASLAIDSTRRHLNNAAWPDACDSYESALRAIIRVQQSSLEFDDSLSDALTRMAAHMRRFCDKVDAARAGKGEFPDAAKVLSAIRQNHWTLAEARAFLEKKA